MTPERWRQIEDLCRQALDRQPRERDAFLREACAGDDELCLEVQSFVANASRAKDFLNKPAFHQAAKAIGENIGNTWIGRRFGAYEMLSLLGVGGMGEVYLGRDTRLKRDVAIKVVPSGLGWDPERLLRLRREAELLAALNHPNIAAVYGLEECEGVPGVVMELVPGISLAERLRSGSLECDEALRIALQIAEALAAAHEKGIIHRDLKPANVKITPEGKVKVLDFGLAKFVARPDAGSPHSQITALTSSGEPLICGTAAYMSPEQTRGQSLDKRTDIWAFGCVLYEMLTGRAAFATDTATDTLIAIREREPDWHALPLTTPAGVQRLLRYCLEKDPQRRLRDLGDVPIALNEAVGLPLVKEKPAFRHALLGWSIAAASTIALLLLALMHFQQPRFPERATLLSILPPDGVTLARGLALSPDGNTLAFSGTRASGQTLLWIRSFDSPDAQALPGTEGAVDPFWAPDGRAIGFFAGGQLKKIEAAGGPPVTICDAVNPRGGAWSQNGVIIFSRNSGFDGILRVSAAGGEPQPVTIPRTGAVHRWPHFLPDGHHFIYLEPQESSIVVASLDSNETKRILPSKVEASYAPPGYLLFARETTLMAQYFDATSLAMTAEPVVVAENITNQGVVGLGNFSVSGNTLAFLGATKPSRLVWLNADGKEIQSIGEGTRGYAATSAGNPELSPDETRLAIVLQDPQTRQPEIRLRDLLRGTVSRLSSDLNGNYNPVWSPDGRRIAFTGNRNGTVDLYQRVILGASGDELLLKTPSRKSPTDWSPDGQFITYTNEDATTKSDIWVLPVNDRRPFAYLTTPFNEGNGRISPNGQWMAYVSDESGQDEVYVQPFPKPGAKIPISTHGGTRPQWSRDGTEVFYVAPDQKLMVTQVRASSAFQAGVPKPVLQLHIAGWTGKNDYAYTRNNYSVTADGKRIFANVSGDEGPSPITVVFSWTARLKR